MREELVVHPKVRDDARVLLRDWHRHFGVAEQIGKARHRELLIRRLGRDVDVGGERFLEPITGAERKYERRCRDECKRGTSTHVKKNSKNDVGDVGTIERECRGRRPKR